MSWMRVEILYVTYNREKCTKITLPTLLEKSGYPFELTIVDNGSTDSTVSYLQKIQEEYGSKLPIRLILNRTNKGLSKPTNEFWQSSGAELVGKIDNDIVVERNWLPKLLDAHKKIPHLAVIGGFHFPLEIFNLRKCRHNLFEHSGVQLLRQAYIGGNYLAKRDVLLKNGPLDENLANAGFKVGGWTEYQLALSSQGYWIGYYYPLIPFEHLHTAEDSYYMKVRGMTAKQYSKWERVDGKKILSRKRKWNNKGD